MPKHAAAIALLVLLLLLSPGPPLRAQTPLPFDELGAGPRATAMGQAFTALADDPSAAYCHAAGLTEIHSPFYLELGYRYAKPRVKVSFDVPPDPNPFLGRPVKDQVEDFSTRGFYAGYVFNFGDVSVFRDSPISRRFSHGLALFTNLPEVNQFDNPQRPQDPYVFKYNERWSLIAIAISFGFRCTEWLSVGGGILPRINAFQDSTGSRIRLNEALAGIVPGVAGGDPAQGFRLDLRVNTKVEVTPIGGVQIRWPFGVLKDRLRIGVSYRGKLDGYYGTGRTSVDVLIAVPGEDPILIIKDPGGRTVDYIGFSPEQVTGGIALGPVQNLLLAFDLTWKRYSAFHFFWDLVPFDKVNGITVKNPFKDVWVPRVGIQYALPLDIAGKFGERFETLSLRTGYYYEPSPVPDMNGPMNILDADQHVVSAGVGLQYNARWTGLVKLDAFFQAHLWENHYIPNDRDPLFSGITVGGQVYNLGVSLSIIY